MPDLPQLSDLDPLAQHDEFRDGPDAVHVSLPGGVDAWVVVRGDLLKQVALDRRAPRDPSLWSVPPEKRPAWTAAWLPESMFNSEGQDHRRLRELIAPALSRTRIAELTPMISEIVAASTDRLAARLAEGTADLRDWGYHIPPTVICRMLGVPEEEQPLLEQVMEAAITVHHGDTSGHEMNMGLMLDAVYRLVEHRRANPDGLVLSDLITATYEGDRLSTEELIATVILLIGAGSETAVAALNSLAVELLQNPERVARLRAEDGEEEWERVIDETLRLHPPVAQIPLRFAAEDITMPDGTVIPAGDAILLAWGAHGRDPGVHDEPGRWDPSRAEGHEHMAFGYGVHYCIGAHLGRAEVLIAARELIKRFPTLELAVPAAELTKRRSVIGADYEEIPVRLA